MSWALPRFDHLVDFAGASHIGRVRSTNEDVWRVDPGLGLFLVADGMGGHASGEVAATMAVNELGNALRTANALRACDEFVARSDVETRRAVFEVLVGGASRAHQIVLSEAERDKQRASMGTTLDAVLLLGSRAFMAHIGDGRAYLSRATTTIQLTHDHTIHGALLARGALSPSEPPVARQEVLTNAVGRKGSLTVEEVYVDLSEGDRLLVCSDGVHNEIDNENSISGFGRTDPPEDAAVAIVNSAVERGGKDNATALVIAIGPRRPERATAPAGLPARDAAFVAHSSLFSGLSEPLIKKALQSTIEVEFAVGATIPRFYADDRVGYIILEGRIDSPDGWTLGPSGVVYPECLAEGGRKGTNLCTAGERTRALRIRSDDLREVCSKDVTLAASIYHRLAHILARVC